MTETLIKIEELHKSFGKNEVLKGINLEIKRGEVVVIIGPSGSGKSTLLRSMNLLEEASKGKVTVKSKVIHNILAIKRDSLATFIENRAKQKIEKVENQKIYDNGVKKIALTNYSDKEITASTEVKVGPEIKESELRTKIADKKSGEVQSILEKIEGVNKVEVKFSYFWVNKIPKDNDKLSIEFTVE